MTSSLSILRHDFPALALAVGFARANEREKLAAGIALWLEVRRALQAQEPMLAATRITWWQDALEKQNLGVPLAENLIKSEYASSLAKELALMVEDILSGKNPSPHEVIARYIGVPQGEAVLKYLDATLKGSPHEFSERPAKIGHLTFDLITWCCAKPERLSYPDKHPLLALKMLWVASLKIY